MRARFSIYVEFSHSIFLFTFHAFHDMLGIRAKPVKSAQIPVTKTT